MLNRSYLFRLPLCVAGGAKRAARAMMGGATCGGRAPRGTLDEDDVCLVHRQSDAKDRVEKWGQGNEAVLLETLLSHYTADTLVSLLTFLVRATH